MQAHIKMMMDTKLNTVELNMNLESKKHVHTEDEGNLL